MRANEKICAETPQLEAMSVVLSCASRLDCGMCLWCSPMQKMRELLVCVMKSMRDDETIWQLLKAAWKDRLQVSNWLNVLQHIVQDRINVVFGTMSFK